MVYVFDIHQPSLPAPFYSVLVSISVFMALATAAPSPDGQVSQSNVLRHMTREWVSPCAHLHVVGMLRFMSNINQPSLPTPFYSVLVSISVFMALSTVFHSINSPDNSPFSHSVLLVLGLPNWSFQLYMSLYESLLQP